MSLRQWFVSGEGIDRSVITADIQRYLGNDATVKPGMGTGEFEGSPGYWIKAYRNLTSAMIADLRADSQKWWQEQRRTGTRASYEKSNTYMNSNAALEEPRHRDLPSMEGQYVGPPGRDRPDPRRPMDRQADPMHIDQQGPNRGPPGRPFQPDPRGFPDERMHDYHPERTPVNYPQDMPMMDQFGRPVPGNVPYGQDPNYGPGHPGHIYQQQQQPQPHFGPPPGHVRQGDQYVPITSSYVQPGVAAVSRPELPYGQPQQGHNPRGYQDQRGPPRDSGYGQPENPERYAYPSPATTVSSVNPREREPMISPPQPSPQGYPQQFDQYGRPIPGAVNPYENLVQGYPPAPRTPPRDQVNVLRPGRQDNRKPPSDDERDVRRRRRN